MTTKICVDCNQDLSISLFSFKNKTKGVLQSRCKPCYNAYNRQYYAAGENEKQIVRSRKNSKAIRVKFQEWKQTQHCCICGEKSVECLDLHHIDPNEKEGNVSQLGHFGSWKRVEEEIVKCVVVCANCHRKIHSGRIECPVSSAG